MQTLTVIIGTSVLFVPILNAIGLRYIYALLLVIGILICMLGSFNLAAMRKSFLLAVLLLCLCTIALISVAYTNRTWGTIQGILTYLLIPTYWLVFLLKLGTREILRSLEQLKWPTVIVALLGHIQFFSSPDLFGILPHNSNAVAWSLGKDFSEFSAFFRAFSTLGSPQVYGLYLSFYIYYLVLASYRRLSLFDSAVAFFLVISGLLSGNKLFVIFAFLPVLSLLNRFGVFSWITAAAVSIAFVSSGFTNLLIFERLLASPTELVQGTLSEGRLRSYEWILANTNPVIGAGPGSFAQGLVSEINAPESYFLKMYYETGAIPIMVMLALFASSIIRCVDSKQFRELGMVVFIFCSMAVVHAFESPVFFIFWGYLISTLIQVGPPIGSFMKLDELHQRVSTRELNS